ncbi:MAG: c-type cytochrome, partial [Thiotrichaceae bacterium]|nr:c-type cytochrome [Thiotrichaceae bacterium]
MQKKQLLSFTIIFSTCSMAIAAGMPDGDHNSHQGMPVGGHWMAPLEEAAKNNPVKRSDNSIAKGATLYQQNCVSCHGENAEGNGPAGMMLNPKPANLR